MADLTLIGMEDEKLEVFYENMERLNTRSLNYDLSIDHMVTGAFIGMLVFNPAVADKGFSDIMPFDYGDCSILPVPLYSQDPIITLNINEEMKRFITDESPDAEAVRQNMPAEMVEAMKDESQVDLEGLSTVYLPRATLSTMQGGVSLYRKLLPLWIYERLLYRGTLTDATRRQKNTLHIKVGNETWVPTDEELRMYLQRFQETEQDPISSYVATVADVQTEEILPPGSDLRWTDMAQAMSEMKQIALGVSVSFLQGDGNYSTADLAISTFLEGVASYRQFVTWKFYYGKLFPLIAHLNEYYKDDKKSGEETSAADVRRLQSLQLQLNETRRLAFPKIEWHKTLRPEANRDYIDVLDQLEQKGVPIPIRTWFAVGGLDPDQTMKDMEGDKALRDRIKQLKPPPPPDQDGLGGGGFASVGDPPAEMPRPRETASLGRVLTRPYAEYDNEVWEMSRSGKVRHWVPSQHRRHRQINERIALSLRRLSSAEEYAKALSRARRIKRDPMYW